jgi:hypothetical protein
MRVDLLLPTLLLACLSIGCVHYTRVVADDVNLSKMPPVLERDTPWRFDASTLDLCVEPTDLYSREPLFEGSTLGQFLDPSGQPVELALTLRSPDGNSFTKAPSRFYLDRNLACFNFHRQVDPAYSVLELRASPELHVSSVYGYWYLYN